jgi:hypothetical protein
LPSSEARQARVLADHAEWLESHQRAMQKHDRAMADLDESMVGSGALACQVSLQRRLRLLGDALLQAFAE